MGVTQKWGIYHDDGNQQALGRQQDIKQAASVDAALTRAQAESLEVAEELVADKATVAAAAALGTVDARSFAGGLVGANFRPTWVEVARDGGPTQRVRQVIRDAVGFIQVDAPFAGLALIGANFRASQLGAGGDATAPARRFSEPKHWAHYGDSLTQGGSPEALAELTGYTHVNAGISGNTAYQAAARAGGTLYQIKVQGEAIPASGGSVAITEHYPAPMPMGHNWRYPGELAGVPGYIQHDGQGFRFHSQGEAKPGPGWLVFTPAVYPKGREGTEGGYSLIIGLGRNDLNLGISVENTICNIQKIIQASTATMPNFLIWEVPPWHNERLGSPAREKYEAFNKALEAAFPGRFVRVASFLRTEDAFNAAGITPTAQDRADMAAGLTPESFRRDRDGHLNAAGNKAWAVYMREEMRKRGWLYG